MRPLGAKKEYHMQNSVFNMKYTAMLIIILVTLICLGLPIQGQVGNHESLSGVVSDEQGGIIIGANIKLVNLKDMTEYTITSDEHGRYSFSNLKPGKYEIIVKVEGFSKEHYSLKIKRNDITEFNIKLPIFGSGSKKIVKCLSIEEKQIGKSCEVHNIRMKIDQVHITYGLIMTVSLDNSIECNCPNTNDFYSGGCVIGEFTHIEMFYCPKCRKNHKEFFKKLERTNKRDN
jgi:hypothetical protein